MPKFFAHHLIFTFLLGMVAGVLSIMGGVYYVSLISQPTQAVGNTSPGGVPSGYPTMEIGAPSQGEVSTTIITPAPTPVVTPVPAESGPRDTDWHSELVVKIINPAPNAEIGPSGSSLIVRGYTGYSTLANGEKRYTPWEWMTMWIDGKQFASYNTNKDFYPCNETGGTIDAKYWCVSRAFDPMGVGNGTHTLTAIAGTKLHGNTRDDVTFVAKGIPAQNNSANSGGGNVITQSKVGTLNASTQGYMYLTGPRNGYLGYKQRVINLYPGTYYIYVYGPTTYKLCNKIKIVINAGKTTLVRYSGGTCR